MSEISSLGYPAPPRELGWDGPGSNWGPVLEPAVGKGASACLQVLGEYGAEKKEDGAEKGEDEAEEGDPTSPVRSEHACRRSEEDEVEGFRFQPRVWIEMSSGV